MRIAIVGGGIAGLAAAYYLETRGQGQVEYTLLESASVFGGKITTECANGYVLEGGPDSFVTYKPAALELCHELGLGDDLIGTNPLPRKTWVWSRGKLHPMPEGVSLIVPTKVLPFLKSPLISWRGKIRMGMDRFIPPKKDWVDGEDESLADFVRRRLGDEALDKLAEPIIAGIYVADAKELSVKSTFPRLLEMERRYGSLWRGARQRSYAAPVSQSDPPPVSIFMTLRNGVGQLTQALIARCNPSALRTDANVVRIEARGDSYRVGLADGEVLETDAVVLATPANVSATLVSELDSGLAAELSRIPYVSSATVSFAFKRSELDHPLDGYGFVVPKSEKRKILACTWSSTKFAQRAPEGHVLLRAYIGEANRQLLSEQADAALVEAAREELRTMMGITAEPRLVRVARWQNANPQYRVGHQAHVAAIEQCAAQLGGLYLVGSAYRGVGIPDCVADAARAATLVLSKSAVLPLNARKVFV